MGIQMNKKGFEFKLGVFAIIAVGMMIFAIGSIISNQSDVYGTDIDSGISDFEKLDEISGTAKGYEGKLTPEDPEPGQDPEAGTFRGVYGIITGIFSAFDIVTGDDGMIEKLVVQLGLPSYVRQGIVAAMFAAIGFTLVAIVFRLARGTA